MKIQLIPVALLSLLLMACGGSSSSGKNNNQNNQYSSQKSSSEASSTTSSSSQAAQAQVLTGVFLDAAVGNIGYRTDTLEGVTSAAGEFQYRAGELVTFFIGALEFPQVPGAAIITPLEIANTTDIRNPVVINISRLLQSLDKDGDPGNGLTITNEAILAALTLDFSVAPEVFESSPDVLLLLSKSSAANTSLVPIETALSHLQDTLNAINGPSSSSSSTSIVSSSSLSSAVQVSSVSSEVRSSSPIIVIPVSSAQSSSQSSTSSTSSEVIPQEVIFWGFNPAAYQAEDNLFTAAYSSSDNNIVNGSSSERYVDGLNIFLSGGTALRFRGVDNRWNFNGASWAESGANNVATPVVGATAPALRAYVGVPVEIGRAFSIDLEWQQSAADGVTSGSIMLIGSDNKVLEVVEALGGTGSIGYSADAGHTLSQIKIAYSRGGVSSGGVHIDNLVRTHTGAAVLPSSSSASSELSTSSTISSASSAISSDAESSVSSQPDTSSASSVSSDASSSIPASPLALSCEQANTVQGFASLDNGTTGGAGGTWVVATTGQEIVNALASKKNNQTPLTIYVNGTITPDNSGTNQFDVKDMNNVSIIGVNGNALFDGIGINIVRANNVIVRNVTMRWVRIGQKDHISIDNNSRNIWIDHNEFYNSLDVGKDFYDELASGKGDIDKVTLSYNHFHDSWKTSLWGSGDGNNFHRRISYIGNYWERVNSRLPLFRFGEGHILNNYYVAVRESGINSRMGAQMRVEANHFEDSKNVLISMDSSTHGFWNTSDNVLQNIEWSEMPAGNCTSSKGCVWGGEPNSVQNGGDFGVYPNAKAGNVTMSDYQPPYANGYVTLPVVYDYGNDEIKHYVLVNAGPGKLNHECLGIPADISVGSGSSSSVSSASSTSSVVISSSSDAGENSSASSVSGDSEQSSSANGEVQIAFNENFDGATAANFYSTYRVNSNGQPIYKKSGGNPVFENGTISLTGARFTIGETGKDLDLSRPYTLSFDVIAATGSGKLQIFVDNSTTSGDRIFNETNSTLVAGQRFILQSSVGTAQSFIQIRTESSTTLVFDNLQIEYTGAAGSSSSTSSSGDIGTSSSAGNNSSTGNISSSSSSLISSSSSSAAPLPSIPPGTGGLSSACYQLATDPFTNWHQTSLQTDQEIVECLSVSLGKPVGYGENAKGGYDPDGNSKLTVIVKHDPAGRTVEEQIRDAVTGEEHNWIVFDKADFAQSHEIGMYRLHCSNPAMQDLLGATEETCVDYYQWCNEKGFGDQKTCMSEFFNKALNKKALQDVPELRTLRNLVVGSNKTLDGRMSEAYFRFSGFAIGRDSTGTPTQTANSIIFTHLNFQGAGHTEDHYWDPDMIRSTGASHDIWIHKNTFDTTGDSAFDVKVGAYNITMSFNEVVDVLRATLHSSSDSHTIDKQITTTMHHNAFVTRDEGYKTLGNTGRRVPLIRHGTSHMFNNVFVNYRKDILSIRRDARVLWEDNMIVVNRAHQEKSNLDAALNELVGNMVRDISGGSFRGEGVYLWFSDAACNLDDTTMRQITAASGSVDDLSLAYTPASQQVITAQRVAAGQELVDYVSATAGKYGELPFNSPLAGNRSFVLGQGKAACQ
jgi:pectate lyase